MNDRKRQSDSSEARAELARFVKALAGDINLKLEDGGFIVQSLVQPRLEMLRQLSDESANSAFYTRHGRKDGQVNREQSADLTGFSEIAANSDESLAR